MAGNPRENTRGKGFWDGGSATHGSDDQSGGRRSGFPGRRFPSKTGVNTDLDAPHEQQVNETVDDNTSSTPRPGS